MASGWPRGESFETSNTQPINPNFATGLRSGHEILGENLA